MGFNCCEKTFSCLFIFFNVIFSVLGLGTLAFGIYLKVDPSASELLNVVETEDGAHYLENSGWIIIGFGSLVLLVCCCGCVGASTKSKCLLGLYIAFAVVIVIGELAALAITVLSVVRNEYKKNTTTEFRNSWDYLQKTFECCGVSNYTDYAPVYKNETDGKVPVTCCVLKGDKNPEDPVPKDKKACMKDSMKMIGKSEFLNIKGCFTKLKDTVMQYSTVLLIVEAVIIAITIIGITIAACLCRTSDDEI